MPFVSPPGPIGPNHLYSVAALTDETGSLVERYGYGPYGDSVVYDASGAVIAESTVGNPYRFTGRRLDGETGLSYFRARYFDHEMGRFVGRDPLRYVDGKSMYRAWFVPRYLDPSGQAVDVEEYQDYVNLLKVVIGINDEHWAHSLFAPDAKCPIVVECVCCVDKETGLTDPYSGHAGWFERARKHITLCSNSQDAVEGIADILWHEFVHALDDCSGADITKCRERACTEIRASQKTCGDGKWRDLGYSDYKHCVQRYSRISTSEDPDCSIRDLAAAFDDCLLPEDAQGLPDFPVIDDEEDINVLVPPTQPIPPELLVP